MSIRRGNGSGVAGSWATIRTHMDAEGGTQGRRCASCGELLGVYEPIVVVVNGQATATTSLAALGEIRAEGVVLEHRDCEAGAGYEEPA